jgi:hypothetical protein
MHGRDDQYVDTATGEVDWCSSGTNPPSCSVSLASSGSFRHDDLPDCPGSPAGPHVRILAGRGSDMQMTDILERVRNVEQGRWVFAISLVCWRRRRIALAAVRPCFETVFLVGFVNSRTDLPLLQPVAILNPLTNQFGSLLLIGLPIACISWTVTHEEVFREPREFCKEKSRDCRPLYMRKLFYLFTCEYCFSHYATALLLILTHFQMLYAGWRGYLISEFALVWVANLYMTIFSRLRLDIKSGNLTIEEQARSVGAPGPVKVAK